ncbi:MAG TPA: L-seryl-tRNA(Sec) selenium transferase, partial [Sedimentibacter sp.]|nr:L-seryl-tRNA(Sec) selenium transferase [Sedimentibacter sp.]
MDVNRYFRMIPKVDLIMEDERIKELSAVTSRDLVLECTRKVTDDIRAFINGNPDKENEINTLIDNIIDSIILKVNKLSSYNMKKVINGTGTILHTNLGRAPISQEAAERAKDIVTGYSNLEFDLESGIRGSRYAHFEKIITRITGA